MQVLKNKSLIAIASVVCVLIIASIACGSSSEPELVATAPPAGEVVDVVEETISDEPVIVEDEEVPEPETESILEIYQLGDVVKLRNSTIVVLGWEIVEGVQFLEPDPGNMLIAVELIVVNSGDIPRSISSMLQTSLKDETAQRYTFDFTASSLAKGGTIDGELSPGEKVRGKVGFQVSEDVQSLEFTFDADIFGSGKIFVDLGSEPVMVEAPSEIPGEREQETYNVGDTVEINDLALRVNEVSSPPGDQFNKPSDGYRFLVIDLTLENKGSQSAAISSLLQMWIKDSASRRYTVDLMASVAAGGALPDGEYVAGETIRGQVGFEVPEDETLFVFVFDGDVWGTGKIFIEVSLE